MAQQPFCYLSLFKYLSGFCLKWSGMALSTYPHSSSIWYLNFCILFSWQKRCSRKRRWTMLMLSLWLDHHHMVGRTLWTQQTSRHLCSTQPAVMTPLLLPLLSVRRWPTLFVIIVRNKYLNTVILTVFFCIYLTLCYPHKIPQYIFWRTMRHENNLV